MLPLQIISSIVTAATATIFVFIIRNLEETGPKEAGNANLTNEALSSEILSELSVEIEANEADYEILEEKLKILESAEPENYEEMEKKEIVEVYESQSGASFISSFTSPQTDLTIEATHNLRSSGQHRPYTLSLHFTPRPRGDKEPPIPWTGCKLNVEWPLPRNVFVDVWALRRLAPFTIDHYPSHTLNPSNIVAGLPLWSVKPKHPDIEVGAYDRKARPFVLTAQVPFRLDRESETPRIENGKLVHADAPWNLDLHVPDLVVRYQTAVRGSLFQKHPNKVAYLPAPNLHFNCLRPEESSGPDSMHVEWQLNRLKPLQISLPVGSATPLVSHVTISSVLFSSLFLFIALLKC